MTTVNIDTNIINLLDIVEIYKRESQGNDDLRLEKFLLNLMYNFRILEERFKNQKKKILIKAFEYYIKYNDKIIFSYKGDMRISELNKHILSPIASVNLNNIKFNIIQDQMNYQQLIEAFEKDDKSKLSEMRLKLQSKQKDNLIQFLRASIEDRYSNKRSNKPFEEKERYVMGKLKPSAREQEPAPPATSATTAPPATSAQHCSPPASTSSSTSSIAPEAH